MIGLLVWATQVFPLLRAWLKPFYYCLFKPQLHFHSVSIQQLEELISILDDNMMLTQHAKMSDLRISQKILSLGGSDIRTKDHDQR